MHDFEQYERDHHAEEVAKRNELILHVVNMALQLESIGVSDPAFHTARRSAIKSASLMIAILAPDPVELPLMQTEDETLNEREEK